MWLLIGVIKHAKHFRCPDRLIPHGADRRQALLASCLGSWARVWGRPASSQAGVQETMYINSFLEALKSLEGSASSPINIQVSSPI